MARSNSNRLHKLDWFHGIELFEADYDDQVFDRHAHSGFAIGTITNGVGGYRCQGADHILPPRTLSLMNPEEPHTGHAVEGQLRYKMLYVSEAAVRGVLDLGEIRGFRAISPEDPGHLVTTALCDLAESLNGAALDAAGRLRAEEALHSVLGAVFSRHGGSTLRGAGREPKAVSRVAEMIVAHVDTAPTEELTVADLAAEVGLNPNYLIQSFSKARGVSPHKYLIFKKVCRAKKMIAEGTPPLDAALALGFYDQAHFIRHFRKVMGVTPGRMVVHRAS